MEQNQILKKELERSARLTGKDVFIDAYKIITEQEKEIERLKAKNKKYLDSIESVQAGRCRLRCPLTEQAVKQAKIDVLNKLRKKKSITIWDIDEIIEELQK